MIPNGIHHLLLFSSLFCITKSQTSCNGFLSFEKVARREPNPSQFLATGTLFEEPGQAVAIECLLTCRRTADCSGLKIDFANSRCSSFDETPESSEDLVRSDSNFFQKVCYPNISFPACGATGAQRLWTFDRVMGAFLDGYLARELKTTNNLDCSAACLLEKSFKCASASYEKSTGRCLLSKESRRTQPQAYRDVYLNGSWVYLENHCREETAVCAYDRKKGKGVQSADLLLFAQDVDACQALCRSERRFLCRSFSFINNRCFLSSDDRISSASLLLPVVPASTYGELVCPSDDCTHGKYLYEKVYGHSLESGEEEAIPVSPLDCEAACDRLGVTCQAASVDFARETCVKLDRNSQGRSLDLKMVVGRTFVEKVCLRIRNASKCMIGDGKVAFMRIPGFEMPASLYTKVLEHTQSRQECQQKCVDEKTLTCKSAVYDEGTAVCRLSPHTLFSLTPSQPMLSSRSYKSSHMENMCTGDNSFLSKCTTKRTKGQKLIYAENMTPNVSSVRECESFCRRDLNCKSFTYSRTERQCILSSVNSRIPDLQVTVKSLEHDYYEFDCSMSDVTTLPVSSSNDSDVGLNGTSVTTVSPDEVTSPVVNETQGPQFRTNMSSTINPPIDGTTMTPAVNTVKTPATVTTDQIPSETSVTDLSTTSADVTSTSYQNASTETAVPATTLPTSETTENSQNPTTDPQTTSPTVMTSATTKSTIQTTAAAATTGQTEPQTVPTKKSTTASIATTTTTQITVTTAGATSSSSATTTTTITTSVGDTSSSTDSSPTTGTGTTSKSSESTSISSSDNIVLTTEPTTSSSPLNTSTDTGTVSPASPNETSATDVTIPSNVTPAEPTTQTTVQTPVTSSDANQSVTESATPSSMTTSQTNSVTENSETSSATPMETTTSPPAESRSTETTITTTGTSPAAPSTNTATTMTTAAPTTSEVTSKPTPTTQAPTTTGSQSPSQTKVPPTRITTTTVTPSTMKTTESEAGVTTITSLPSSPSTTTPNVTGKLFLLKNNCYYTSFPGVIYGRNFYLSYPHKNRDEGLLSQELRVDV